jgi:cell division protein FtsB
MLMGRTTHLTDRAIQLVRIGKLEDARRVLAGILQEEPDNWRAWAWYYEAGRDDDDRILALENLLRIRPGNEQLQAQLIALLKKRKPENKPQRQEPARIPTGLFSCLAVVLLGFALLAAFLAARNIQVSRKIESLTTANRQLAADYDQLRSAFTGLQANFQSMQGQYNQLTWEYQNRQNELADLQSRYNDLASQYDLLNQQFSTLESKAIVPPYIYIQGREVWSAFEKTDGQIIYWKTPFEGLESDLQRGSNIRSSIDRERNLIDSGHHEQVTSNHWLLLNGPGSQQIGYVIDERLFVDWREFSNVIPQLYNQAANDWEFIHEVWNIVAQLTTYSSEITDTPRYPLETLLAGGGDCEDTAILFASMILAAPVNWDVYMVYMDGYNPYNTVEMNHVIVYIETGNSSYFVETTSKTEMNPYTEPVDGWYYKINK